MSANWELFETFLAVMRTGSLSAASRSLRVAQPTVRRRIAQLEGALSTVLFTRATNGLVPMESAHATVPHAEAMESAAAAFVRSVSGQPGEARGTVRVTASEVMGAEVVPGVLRPLLAAHPGLHVELLLSNRSTDLLRRDADVAVRMVTPTQEALVAKKVATRDVGLFAHADYLAGRPRVKTLADVLHPKHALVGQDRERGLIDALARLGLETSPRDYTVRTDHDLAQHSAIRAGLGIGVMQVALAKRTPGLKRLVPAVTVPLPVWVVMHEDLRTVRRVRLVFDALVAGLS